MFTSGRFLLVGVIAVGGYVVANDVQPEEVILALGNATEDAQDFASEIEFKDGSEFPSIVLDNGSGGETVVVSRQSSGAFNQLGPTSAVAFGLDTETETDLSVGAPSVTPRPSAQKGTAAVQTNTPETTTAAPATTAAPKTTTTPETTSAPATTTVQETTTTAAPATTTTEAPETTTTEAPASTTTAAPETTTSAAPETTVPEPPAE